MSVFDAIKEAVERGYALSIEKYQDSLEPSCALRVRKDGMEWAKACKMDAKQIELALRNLPSIWGRKPLRGHDPQNQACPMNDPETFCNPATAGMECTCG